jgi:hypothetical protein
MSVISFFPFRSTSKILYNRKYITYNGIYWQKNGSLIETTFEKVKCD